MIITRCSHCKLEKPESEFGKVNGKPRHECKQCRKEAYYFYHKKMLEQKRLDYQKHKETRSVKNAEYYEKNKEKIAIRGKNYYQENKKNWRKHWVNNKQKIYTRKRIAYYKKKGIEPPPLIPKPIEVINGTHRICSRCKEMKEIIHFNKGCYCKPCGRIVHQIYRSKDKEKVLQREKNYRCQNIEKIRLRKQQYRQSEEGYKKTRAYKSQLQVRIADRLRSQLKRAVNNYYMVKEFNTLDYLGCDILYFIGWIKCQFTEDMSERLWKEGAIHLDHFKPLVSFDLTKEEEVKKAFHYTNIRPLFASENCSKATQDKLMKKV